MTDVLSRTVAERVTDALRSRILSGGYLPGAPLRQDAVAAELGVSRIPLREALNHLQAEGLVAGAAHRGFVVRGVSRAEAEEIFGLRLQLEPKAVAEGARMASDDDRSVVGKALAKLNAAATARQLDMAADLNRLFHVSLILPKKNPLTGELLTRLHAASQRYVSLHLSPDGRDEKARAEHETLYTAWSAGDGDTAARITTAHVERTRQDLLAAIAA
jgi:DNA-binding GntR family transcriptional regulator